MFSLVLIFCISNVFFPQALGNYQPSRNMTTGADRYHQVPMYNKALNEARIIQLKRAVLFEFIRTLAICYERFQYCSQKLSPTFCASPTRNLTFYIWARKIADDIMSGYGDSYKSVKCNPEQITGLAKILKIESLQRRSNLQLWSNIGNVVHDFEAGTLNVPF